VTGSGRLRDGCRSTTVRVTALIGQNISSRLHCGEGNWGQNHLSCFPGPESNGSSLRGMLLLPSGSGGSTVTPLAAVVALGEGICCYRGVSIDGHFYYCSSLPLRRKHNTVAFQVSFGHA
jgi:hypothetical protein